MKRDSPQDKAFSYQLPSQKSEKIQILDMLMQSVTFGQLARWQGSRARRCVLRPRAGIAPTNRAERGRNYRLYGKKL